MLLVESVGANSTFFIFHAFGDRLFVTSNKKSAKNAALKRRGAGTAQIVSAIVRQAVACSWNAMYIRCETDSHAMCRII